MKKILQELQAICHAVAMWWTWRSVSLSAVPSVKIVSSVVADIIMPPVGLLIGGVNFSDLKITLKEAVMKGGAEVTRPSR